VGWKGGTDTAMEMSGMRLPVHRPAEHAVVPIENGLGTGGAGVD